MTSWKDRPPSDDKIPSMNVRRTPPRGNFKTVIISAKITGAMTHYAQSRTQLCHEDDCPECRKHHLPRWYGYLAVFNPTNGARVLFEFPAGPIATFNDYLTKFTTLRGAGLKAWRQPMRANGPVQIELSPPGDEFAAIPPEVDVFRLLCQLWKIRHTDQLESHSRQQRQREGPALAREPLPPLKKEPPTTDLPDILKNPPISPSDLLKFERKHRGTNHT